MMESSIPSCPRLHPVTLKPCLHAIYATHNSDYHPRNIFSLLCQLCFARGLVVYFDSRPACNSHVKHRHEATRKLFYKWEHVALPPVRIDGQELTEAQKRAFNFIKSGATFSQPPRPAQVSLAPTFQPLPPQQQPPHQLTNPLDSISSARPHESLCLSFDDAFAVGTQLRSWLAHPSVLIPLSNLPSEGDIPELRSIGYSRRPSHVCKANVSLFVYRLRVFLKVLALLHPDSRSQAVFRPYEKMVSLAGDVLVTIEETVALGPLTVDFCDFLMSIWPQTEFLKVLGFTFIHGGNLEPAPPNIVSQIKLVEPGSFRKIRPTFVAISNLFLKTLRGLCISAGFDFHADARSNYLLTWKNAVIQACRIANFESKLRVIDNRQLRHAGISAASAAWAVFRSCLNFYTNTLDFVKFLMARQRFDLALSCVLSGGGFFPMRVGAPRRLMIGLDGSDAEIGLQTDDSGQLKAATLRVDTDSGQKFNTIPTLKIDESTVGTTFLWESIRGFVEQRGAANLQGATIIQDSVATRRDLDGEISAFNESRIGDSILNVPACVRLESENGIQGPLLFSRHFLTTLWGNIDTFAGISWLAAAHLNCFVYLFLFTFA